MKVLFICRGNVGRSQMAEGILKKLRPDIDVSSAGTKVEKDGVSKHGQVLKDVPLAENVLDALNEIGVDMKEAVRTQLSPEMLDNKDIIVVMAEKENIPEYLSSHPAYIYWDVADSKGKDLAFHRKTRDEIEGLIMKNINLFE